MTTIFSLLNWNTRTTTPFDSVEDAREAITRLVAPGESYTIWAMPQQVGAATRIEDGTRPADGG